MAEHDLGDLAALRAHFGEPKGYVARKELPALNRYSRRFIELSPILFLATAAPDGGPADNSPRGDAPGFVAILDDRTIAIPDRPGNKRVDSHQNIVANPQVGIVMLVPGVDEVLRINGKARVTTDPTLLARMVANGKPPLAAIVVDIAEAYFHCGKALIRADLWNPDKHIARKDFASLSEITEFQFGVDREKHKAMLERDYAENLY